MLSCALLMLQASFAQTLIKLDKRIHLDSARFYITEVIDSRSQKGVVGFVQKGLNNKLETAVLSRPLETELSVPLAELMQARSDRMPLILRIQKLGILERTANGETANADLILEFYQKTDSGIYLLKSTASSQTSKGIDVTNHHEGNILSCFTDCLKQVNDQLRKKNSRFETGEKQTYTRLEAVARITDTYHFGILKDTMLRAGVYKNFIEFRNNAPSKQTNFKIKEKSNPSGDIFGIKKGVVQADGKKDADVWGYSDGDHIFIKLGEEFFPLDYDDGIFWFTAYEVTDSKLTVKDPGQTMFLFGLVGMALKSKISWSTVKKNYAINLGNGDLFPLD